MNQSPPRVDRGAARALVRRAWLFGAPAALGILGFVILLAVRQGALTSKERINFLTNSALGITTGMPVKLNGFVIGTVDRIALLPPSVESALRVRVELGIYHDYMSYIPKTTVARLLQEGLIGQSVIELLPQRYDARPVANGEVLAFERSMGLGEIAEQLQGKLAPVLRNTEALTASLNDPQGDFQQGMKAARVTLAALPATNAQIQRSVAQTGDAIARVEQQVGHTLAGAGRAVATVNDALPGLLGKLDHTIDNLRRASGDVRQMTAGSAEALPALLDDTREVAGGGKRIIDGALGSWPLNRMLPQAAPRAIELDSQQGLPPLALPPAPPAGAP